MNKYKQLGKALVSGFSLIEVMVVVAILGILAAIALPQYDEYVTRGRLVDAFSQLSAGRVRAEQFYQDNRTFVGMPCPGDTATVGFACASTATTYTITATGAAALGGFAFTIDQANNRATTGVKTGWTTNASCWVVSKGGGCS